jgi:hypothetical protein
LLNLLVQNDLGATKTAVEYIEFDASSLSSKPKRPADLKPGHAVQCLPIVAAQTSQPALEEETMLPRMQIRRLVYIPQLAAQTNRRTFLHFF